MQVWRRNKDSKVWTSKKRSNLVFMWRERVERVCLLIKSLLYVRHCADSMIIQRGNNYDEDLEKSPGFSDWTFKGFVLGQMVKEWGRRRKNFIKFFLFQRHETSSYLLRLLLFIWFSVYLRENSMRHWRLPWEHQ